MAASMPEENLENFFKILQENIVNIREMCTKYKNRDAGIEAFAERSLEKLEELEKKVGKAPGQSKVEFNVGQIKECLQLYAQVMLDITFCEENILVDGVFPEKNAAIRVHKLLTMLRQPEIICQHCFPSLSPKELLGEEILECMLWRRGALLYMYCHTIQEDVTRLSRETNAFIENCADGALYLQQMLRVRQPLQEERHQVLANDDHMFTLLKKGVFSETHVLSLLYAGELCYWHLKHSKSDTTPPQPATDAPANTPSDATASTTTSTPTTPTNTTTSSTTTTPTSSASPEKSQSEPAPESSSSSKAQVTKSEKAEFSAKEIGSQLLSLYLDIVQGPLKNHGWRLERATELLAFIDQAEEGKTEEKS